MTKKATPAALSLERKEFSNMNVRELHGMIGRNAEHLRNNIANGVFKKFPRKLDGLLYAYLTRKDELEQFERDWARRPRIAFEATYAKRRAEAEEYEDAIPVEVGLGAGGVQRHLVPLKNVKDAARRADD